MAGALHSGVYSGMVMASCESSAPTGWLACDGTFKSTSTYSDLFNAIGHTYNNGIDPGDGTFKLPDLNNNRAPMGASVYYPPGTTGGSNSHNHTFNTSVTASTNNSGAHTHSVPGPFTTSSDGAHGHNFNAAATSGNASGTVNTAKSGGTYSTALAAHTHSATPMGSNSNEGGHSHDGTVSGFNVDGSHSHNATTNNPSISINYESSPHHLVFYLIKT